MEKAILVSVGASSAPYTVERDNGEQLSLSSLQGYGIREALPGDSVELEYHQSFGWMAFAEAN